MDAKEFYTRCLEPGLRLGLEAARVVPGDGGLAAFAVALDGIGADMETGLAATLSAFGVETEDGFEGMCKAAEGFLDGPDGGLPEAWLVRGFRVARTGVSVAAGLAGSGVWDEAAAEMLAMAGRFLFDASAETVSATTDGRLAVVETPEGAVLREV